MRCICEICSIPSRIFLVFFQNACRYSASKRKYCESVEGRISFTMFSGVDQRIVSSKSLSFGPFFVTTNFDKGGGSTSQPFGTLSPVRSSLRSISSFPDANFMNSNLCFKIPKVRVML